MHMAHDRAHAQLNIYRSTPENSTMTCTPCMQAIVFCNRKPAAEWLAHRLSAAGYPSAHLSSDLPQPERMAAMSALRGFLLRVMVCTDVMARGVDLDRVNLVALLDLPPDAATYVHRVGRTGRFGTRGISIAFVTPPELQQLKAYMDEARGGGLGQLAVEAVGSVGVAALSLMGLCCDELLLEFR